MELLLLGLILFYFATSCGGGGGGGGGADVGVTVTMTPPKQPHPPPPIDVVALTTTITRNYLNSQPYFDLVTSSSNVTAQLGQTTFLPCKVRNLSNKSVSWIRKRDSHILTVDRYTFIADERFQVLHQSHDNWMLKISFVQERDGGTYECQITTEPKKSLFINLTVIVPKTTILNNGGDVGGESDLFVKSGSGVVIKCIISDAIETPDYVFWYKDGGRVLTLGSHQGGYQHVEKLSGDTTLAMLVIKSTTRVDSGNYTCAPSNLQPASIVLHVLSGEEQPAAISQDTKPTVNGVSSNSLSTMMILLINYWC